MHLDQFSISPKELWELFQWDQIIPARRQPQHISEPSFPSLQSDDTTNIVKLLQGLIVVMAMSMLCVYHIYGEFIYYLNYCKREFCSLFATPHIKNPKNHRQISEPMAFLVENPGRSGRIR